MNAALQSILLRLYRAVSATGFLSGGLGRRLFDTAYERYKASFEAGAVEALRPSIGVGGWVIDVGANVGFFTERFARWVDAGRVIAIEPEHGNFVRLTERMARAGLAGKVICVQAAVAESSGVLNLAVNPEHPGDHRLATAGVAVQAVTIDGLLAEHGRPAVSLIKIDVQGAEARVLAGAVETLARSRPALYVEVDDAALRSQGSGAEQLLSRLEGLGYAAHRLGRSGPPLRLSRAEVIAAIARPPFYADFLFVADANDP